MRVRARAAPPRARGYRQAGAAAEYDPMTLGRRVAWLHGLEDCDRPLGKGECPMCIAFCFGMAGRSGDDLPALPRQIVSGEEE